MMLPGFDAAGSEELRAVLVATGRITRRVRLAERLDAEVSGSRVRVSSAPAAASNSMSSAPTESGVAAIASVCPPASPPASWAAHCAAAWCSCRAPPARSRRTVTIWSRSAADHAIGLTGTVFRFVTPSIVADAGGNLAGLDRRALTVAREVTDAPGGWLTPVAGGVAVGLGSRLYDSHLALVAAHPSVPAAASAPVASGARLYALTLRCAVAGRVDGAIGVGARTGAVVARRKGPFAIGRLGGPVARPAEDACD